MPYKIPHESEVIRALISVMNRKSHINSQKELATLVRNELYKKDSEYRISEKRIRHTGIEYNLIQINIKYNKSENNILPGLCPVCENVMKPVQNKSLEGLNVETQRKCTVCTYGFGNKVLTPGRYIFSKPSKEITENLQRIRKLEKAKVKLKEALLLIADALKATDIEERENFSKNSIKNLISSKEESGSIVNLISDLKELENEPLWMKPLTSVKNINRKDKS